MGVWEGRKKGKENKPKKKGGATEEWWEKNKLKNGEKRYWGKGALGTTILGKWGENLKKKEVVMQQRGRGYNRRSRTFSRSRLAVEGC